MATLRTLRRKNPSLFRYNTHPSNSFCSTSLHKNPHSDQTLDQPERNSSTPLVSLDPSQSFTDAHLVDKITSIFKVNSSDSFSSFKSQLNPSIVVNVLYNFSRNLELGRKFVDKLRKFLGFNHSSTSLSAVIHILVRSRSLNRARVLIRRMVEEARAEAVVNSLVETYQGCGSNPLVFCLLIRTCVEDRKLTEAAEAFRVLISRGFSVPINACNSLLGGLVKANLIDMAWQIYGEVIGSETQVNVFTLNIMVNAMCKKRELKQARTFLLGMEEKGVFADTVTYNTLINAHCLRGNFEEAIRLTTTMEANDLRPTLALYNAIITCLCEYEYEKYSAAEVTLAEISSIGLNPATTTDNGLVPNKVSFSLLIGMLSREGETDRALVYFREMHTYGLVPDSVIYTMLIGGLCRDGKLFEALDMRDEMVAKGCQPDVSTYNILLNGMRKEKKLPQPDEIFTEMIKRGISPDYYTFTTLIHGYCNEGYVEKALDLFRRMIMVEKNLKLHFGTFIILINGFCKDGDMEKVNELWNDVKSKRLSPIYVSYSILINAFCDKGRVEDALKLWYEMVGKGIHPSTMTCNSVIKGYCLLGNSTGATKFSNKMRKNGITPDATTYNTLIEGFVNEGNFYRVGALISKMRSLNLFPDVTAYKFLPNMIKRGMEPDKSIYKSLIDGCVSKDNL